MKKFNKNLTAGEKKGIKMDLIKKILPKTYYADRGSEERIKLFVEHWRRLVKVNQELEEKVSCVELPVKVKQKIADTVKDIMQEGFEIAMGGNIDLSEEANRREQTARYDRAVKNYTEIIARNFSA